MKSALRQLYLGNSNAAQALRIGLFFFDLVTIIFLVASSFHRGETSELLDTVIGLVIALDFAARLFIDEHRWRFLRRPASIADLLVILSLLAPVLGEGLAFLRVFRVARLLRSEWVFDLIEEYSGWMRKNRELVHASINLAVFIFLMTALVYETQHRFNPKIGNYLDALYFTVTTLTTTGFGDVTLDGNSGKLIAVFIMVCGVSLFLRLIQVMMRPAKAAHTCPQCGLTRHDHDAVHCKACGLILNIRDEGAD
jgi:voltage-gated potassium channel